MEGSTLKMKKFCGYGANAAVEIQKILLPWLNYGK